jgi:hypothetical protein
MSSNDLVSSDQVAFGKRLGLELDGKSVSEAYALILDMIDKDFFNITELGSATPKQIAFAAKYQRNIGAASRRVADAVITDLMTRLNDEAIERERLAPGVAVRNVHDAMQRKHVISSIREDGTIFFKGGNGAKAWARSLVRVDD